MHGITVHYRPGRCFGLLTLMLFSQSEVNPTGTRRTSVSGANLQGDELSGAAKKVFSPEALRC